MKMFGRACVCIYIWQYMHIRIAGIGEPQAFLRHPITTMPIRARAAKPGFLELMILASRRSLQGMHGLLSNIMVKQTMTKSYTEPYVHP